MKKTIGIILAAGRGTRMGENKMLMRICGYTPIELCMRAMEESCVDEIIITVTDDTARHVHDLPCTKPVKTVLGGETRGESVYNALCAAQDADIAVIHDGARCLVTPDIINRSVEEAKKYGSAVASLPVSDTVRNFENITLDRDSLRIMHTPQAFQYELIRDAYEKDGMHTNTDDCGVFIQADGNPHYFESDFMNQKLTRPSDIAFFESCIHRRLGQMRVGIGEDTHRLVEGRKLILGGVEIDYRMGLLGHSDADVLCHAISDAVLGACALGDIGKHFPDTDPAYKGANSVLLLHRVMTLCRENGFCIVNVDATVTAQEPKLAPHIEKMRENLSGALGVDVSCVSVKATTPEHTGPEGNLECITVRAVATVQKIS